MFGTAIESCRPRSRSVAWRIVSGLSVKQIARDFLGSATAAMEQRITRAEDRVAAAHVSFEAPGAWIGRSVSPTVAAAHPERIFNQGTRRMLPSNASCHEHVHDEAIRLGRLLLGLFQTEPEIMGLTALVLLQHARAGARFDTDGAVVLLEDQDRSKWNRNLITEGLALIDKAIRHRRPGPYQVQAAIAALHARAARFEDLGWLEIEHGQHAPAEPRLPAPPAPRAADGSFAARVKQVAEKLTTPPFQGRVAIAQVYDAYGRIHPDAGSLQSFKARLVEAAKARTLVLGRLDMPEGMPRDLRERSETLRNSDEVHFVITAWK